jgi:outer membrane protein assembly factor BamA
MSSGSLRFAVPFGPAGFRAGVSASADRIIIRNEVDLQRSFRQRYGISLDKKSGRYLRFETTLEAGLKKNYYRSRDDESLWQMLYGIRASSEIETFRHQSVYLRLVSEGIFSGGEIHPAELYPVGGARSIRGYRENQFRTERVSYLNLEYRLGKISRVFLFSDTGVLYREDTGWKLRSGAGFGLRSVSAVGIIELSFGVAERFSLDAARIHVSLVESF